MMVSATVRSDSSRQDHGSRPDQSSKPDNSSKPPGGYKRRRWLPVLLWLVFAAGLLTQALSPRLKIENGAFVIPPSWVNDSKNDPSKPINPAEIVTRAKHMQLLSATLTLGGAVSLGFYYWPFLVGRRST